MSAITRLAVDMKFPIHIHIQIFRGYPWMDISMDISISTDAFLAYI